MERKKGRLSKEGEAALNSSSRIFMFQPLNSGGRSFHASQPVRAPELEKKKEGEQNNFRSVDAGDSPGAAAELCGI